MYYPLTSRQQLLLAQLDPLVERFAARAAEQDRTGLFPHQNFVELRAAGLPGMIVPSAFGGGDATLTDAVMAMERLAMGDGSTALAFTMHVQTLGAVAEGYREGACPWPLPLFETLCRAAVEQGALINSIATEPELGSPSRGGRPKTVAVPDDPVAPGAWVLSGHKSWASLIPALDYLVINATLKDGSDDVARFVVSNGPGIEVIETWDALGMRTTASHDIRLHAVRVPQSALIARSPVEKLPPFKGNPWFMLTVSAVYLGVAAAAVQAAALYAHERVPTALGKPIAELESVQRRLGEAELLLNQARLLLYHVAQLWDQPGVDRSALAPLIVTAKVTSTNNAVAAVDQAMRVAGGASFTRSLSLERLYRDVRGGLSHPIGDDEAYLLLGRAVLQRHLTAS